MATMNERDEEVLRAVLAERSRDRFAAGFADRATQRWRVAPDARESLDDMVWRGFRRLVPLAAAAMIVLALHNVGRRDRAQGQSTAAALVGLTPAAPAPQTIEDLYELGALGALRGR
jgi:hypothetical protein